MFLYKLRQFYENISSKLNVLMLQSALASCGKNIMIHGTTWIENPQQVALGKGVQLLKGVTIKSRSHTSLPSILLGENVKIHEYTYLDDYGGSISIGDNSGIGHLCVIAGHGGLKIGRDCMIAGCTYIIPANHTFDSADDVFRNQPETRMGITIEDNVWIGAGCIILDGVTIGSNAVIGAGSVVTKDVPPGVVAIGNPAKICREIEHTTKNQI